MKYNYGSSLCIERLFTPVCLIDMTPQSNLKKGKTNAQVIERDSSDPEPDLLLYPAAFKRFFSYYHNRNAPSSTKYPFVVQNQRKKQKVKNLVNTNPATTSTLRNLMETMTDDEIINEILNMEMDKAVLLAKDIIIDLRVILKQLRSSENKLRKEQEELENTIQRALDPNDPGRLLRLS